MTRKNTLRKILMGVLVLIVLVNLSQVLPDVLQFGKGILENIHQPGLWRGARFARSRNFADYVLFLNEQVPEDAEVVLPPEEAAMWTLANTPAMEYFLSPRKIRNCTELACGKAFLDRSNTYILIMGQDRFPGKAIQDHPERIRMYNDTWGVYGPEAGLGQGGAEGYPSVFLTAARGVLFPVLAYFLWFAVGGLLIGWLMPDLDPWMSMGLGFGTILGLKSMFLYLGLLLGISNIAGIVLILYLVLAVLILYGWQSSRFDPWKWFRRLLSREGGGVWRVLLLGMGGLLTYLAVGSGHHATDAYVLWGAKGAGILSRGLPGVVAGTNTTRYPLHIPLLIAGQKALYGDVLPASKLIFPGYYYSLLIVLFGYLKDRSGDTWAGLTSLAAASMPVVMRHGRIGYANLPLAFYLICGALMIVVFHEGGGSQRNAGGQVLGGLMLAFAVWTRPEGIWQVLGLLAVYSVWFLYSYRRKPVCIPWQFAGIPILFWLGWTLSSRGFYDQIRGSGSFVRILTQEVLQGRFHLSDLGHIFSYALSQMVNPEAWGTAGVAVLILGAAARFFVRREAVSVQFLGAAGALFVILMIGVYFTFAFEPVHDLDWWLTSGFNRMILPGMLLVWLSASEAAGYVFMKEL